LNGRVERTRLFLFFGKSYARQDELEIITVSGARSVTNFSSNLHLHSGLAPTHAGLNTAV